jgi:hypothetical protein
MAAIAQNTGPVELRILAPGGVTRSVVLERDRYRLGRAGSNELCFPDVTGLSREHLVFEREGSGWVVRDLGSTNGTYVNGIRIDRPCRLHPADRVTLGLLTMVFSEGIRRTADAVVFVEDPSAPAASTTISASLDGLLAGESEGQGSRRMKALIRAGRELAGHMPLETLFDLILNLSVEAVGDARGVLMTLAGGELQVRATRGAGFRISSLVRDLVMNEKRSLLVRDVLTDQVLAARMSIVERRPCRPRTVSSDLSISTLRTWFMHSPQTI